MLVWAAQLELAKALWDRPEVRGELAPVLRPDHFSNPALGRIIGVLLSQDGQVPSPGQLEQVFSTYEPHARDSCLSLLPDVQRASCPTASWAVEHGRAFAFFQEANILAGQLPELARAGKFQTIRDRIEETLKIGERVDVPTDDDLVVSTVSSVVSRRVDWLWPGFLAYGKISMFDGDPGVSKSTLLMDIAARLTTARAMPMSGEDSIARVPADVVVLSAEDSLDEIIRPRLEAASADLARVHVLTAVKEKHGLETTERTFAVLQDAKRLDRLVERTNAKLLVVDPLVSYLGYGVDFHRDQDMRRVMGVLGRIAETRGVACVCVRHMNKDQRAQALYRGGGSIGIVGAARVAFVMTKHPNVENQRVLAVTKTNLSKPPAPMVLELEETEIPEIAKVAWRGPSSYTVEELLAKKEEKPKTDSASAGDAT